MLAINGTVNVSFDTEELRMLLTMVEGAVYGAVYDGDEPSDMARQVLRKVLLLQAVDEASGQGSLLRGGDSFDPRIYDYELRERVGAEEYDRLTLGGGRGQ